MEDFHQQFLRESVERLKDWEDLLRRREDLSAEEKADLFRMLHTVKGTSQVFGLTVQGKLAHRLEEILANDRIARRDHALLLEGIGQLIKSLEQKDPGISPEFLEKPNETGMIEESSEDLVRVSVPADIFSQLSPQEKKMLRTAIENKEAPFGLEIVFGLGDFAVGLKNFREKLKEAGRIIATLPAPDSTGAGRIGFRILMTGRISEGRLEMIAAADGARVFFRHPPADQADQLREMLRRITCYGRDIAGKSGKDVQFEISGAKIELPARAVQIVFETLVHLIRNAVDHAFAGNGRVVIDLEKDEGGLRLKVSDNGRGIDPQKVLSTALEKNLISAGDDPDEEAVLDLIFRPGFSTALTAGEISGRGVGLDAVKTALEENGGKISVSSTFNKGTVFEIFLPL